MKKHTRKTRSTREKQAQSQKRKRNILIAFMCVVLVCVGYIGTDAFMLRHAEPVSQHEKVTQKGGDNEKKSAKIKYRAVNIPSVALDNSVMLSSVINEVEKKKFSCVSIELKREDGTIGYASNLTTADTFGAVSMPATKLHDSLKALRAKDITVLARICCYKDNVIPKKSSEFALKDGNKLYTDSNGNTYLNPDSDATVNYLKDIVVESYNLGVRFFVLSDVKLPDGIRKGHRDGFNNLVNALKNEVGGDAVFVEAKKETLNGWDAEDGEYNLSGLNNEISKLEGLKNNQIYLFETKRTVSELNKALKKNKIKGYIIIEKD